MTAAEIASRTHLSVGTVRTHIRRIYLKVGVKSREGLLGRFAPYSLS
jgi:DNA-binding CsgD family transcriptional regulator